MNVTIHEPPRRFSPTPGVELADCARIDLAPGEQVTFVPGHDVTRTGWGYYVTASVNARLPQQGFMPMLVRNDRGRAFVVLVMKDRRREFEDYCTVQALRPIASLADDGAIDAIESACGSHASP